jgi:glycosyltransferase involved in cell wall biosynthesis
MKILLSSYACGPGRGSEPGVGWNWALTLAGHGHEVWVLSREEERAGIEAVLQGLPDALRLHFAFYDPPRWACWWKKGEKGVHLYYQLWQFGIVKVAGELHARVHFDLVHHITFGVFRQPSYLWVLGVPFVFGPLGGGERAPYALRRSFGWAGWFWDLLRDGANLIAGLDPTLRKTFSSALLIVVKTPQTLDFVPRSARHKTLIALETGIDVSDELPLVSPEEAFRVLFVGRFIDLKGIHLALRAFAEFARAHSQASLTLVGKGPRHAALVALATELGIANQVRFIDWMPQEQLAALYRSHQVFLFPSLHDSSGNVVLEALSHALPVVCLKLGGPAMFVDEQCGRVIEVTSLNESAVVERLSIALREIAASSDLRSQLRSGALARAVEYTWDRVVGRVYERIEVELSVRNQKSGT